jgi:signal transduction histidine kinase
MERALRKRSEELCERVKELNCLYSISRLIERRGITLEGILQGVVALIPAAWQFTDVACARIILGGETYCTPNFKATHWRQSAPIRAHGKQVGTVEVHYLTRMPEMDDGPFLSEERNLLLVIAAHLGKMTERIWGYEALQRSNVQLRELTAHIQSVREEERHRIAHEVHDDLGQALTALKIDISCVGRKLPDEQAYLRERLCSMSTLVDMIIRNVQRIATELRPAMLDDLDLAAAILWQAKEFQERTGIECRIAVKPEEIGLDRDSTTMLFRIFQEMLTNVTRHSRALRVKGALEVKGSAVVLRVRDDGRGITPEQAGDRRSFGIFGIRERARLAGGTVTIKGVPGKGTTVAVRIPLREREGDR